MYNEKSTVLCLLNNKKATDASINDTDPKSGPVAAPKLAYISTHKSTQSDARQPDCGTLIAQMSNSIQSTSVRHTDSCPGDIHIATAQQHMGQHLDCGQVVHLRQLSIPHGGRGLGTLQGPAYPSRCQPHGSVVPCHTPRGPWRHTGPPHPPEGLKPHLSATAKVSACAQCPLMMSSV